MGLTQKLGTIPLAILTDASNNIGIGAAPSGSYKLEVTGTAKVSSTLLVSGASTFNSDLTIGGTQPNGIINYTSASSYGRIYFSESGTFKAAIQFMGSTFVTTSRQNALEIINTTTGDLALGTGDARTFFIKNGGNVGIGTGSPQSFGSFAVRLATSISGSNVSASFSDAVNSTFDIRHGVGGSGNVVDLSAQGGALTFSAGSAERMRITSAGYLKASNNSTYDDAAGSYHELYSNTAGNYAVTMTGQNATNSGLFIKVNNSSTSYSFLACYSVSVANYMLYIRTNGAIYSNTTSITPISSDVNLKTDILDYDKGLNEVLAMKPRYFKYKDNLEEQKIGFIAQEMDEALPGSMINGSENPKTKETYKTYQVEWYPLLVKAIQEQNQIIQELNERLNKAGL